ncbi:hypothetical protein C364_00072 [Cryptococcus neoformans Bt63]|nr:hypothetical protein C364_00072 [Cryptococcus neoformans var. grubii Bt63]
MMTDKWSGGKRWGWADEYIMHRPHKGVHNQTQGMGGLRWRIFDYLSDQGAILRLDLSTIIANRNYTSNFKKREKPINWKFSWYLAPSSPNHRQSVALECWRLAPCLFSPCKYFDFQLSQIAFHRTKFTAVYD